MNFSAVQASHLAEFKIVYQQSFAQTQGATRFWTASELEQEVMQEHVWGAWEERKLVGFLVTLPIDSDTQEILSLGVLPAWRQQLVAEKLLRWWFSEQIQARRVLLEVHERNLAAQNLYTKLGFTELSRRAGYYPDGGHALILQKLLNPEVHPKSS